MLQMCTSGLSKGWAPAAILGGPGDSACLSLLSQGGEPTPSKLPQTQLASAPQAPSSSSGYIEPQDTEVLRLGLGSLQVEPGPARRSDTGPEPGRFPIHPHPSMDHYIMPQAGRAEQD